MVRVAPKRIEAEERFITLEQSVAIVIGPGKSGARPGGTCIDEKDLRKNRNGQREIGSRPHRIRRRHQQGALRDRPGQHRQVGDACQ